MNIKSMKSLFICYFGHEKCEPGHSFGPAIRLQYLLHYVICGEGIYRANNQSFHLKAGDAFIMNPNESVCYEADQTNPWEYIWIAFDGYDAKQIAETIGFWNNYTIAVPRPDEFAEKFYALIDALTNRDSNEYERFSFFYKMASHLFSVQNGNPQTTRQEYYDKATRYIDNNFSYPIKISDIASHVGIDRTYLYKIFIEEKNESPKDYLLEIRINTAKNLLLTTSLTITEVALSCGFHDLESFCSYFKRKTKRTPRQFIKEISSI